jgi:hypothetical protein
MAQHKSGEPIMLPSGAEVVIRDPGGVRHRDRRAYVSHYEAAVEGVTDPAERGFRLLALFTAFAVEKWTLDMPLLSDGLDTNAVVTAVVAGLDDLSPADYDALQAAIKPVDKAMFPNFSVSPEPDSPTGP